MSAMFSIPQKKSQGTPHDQQNFQESYDQEQIELPISQQSPLSETVTNPSSEVENFAIPCSTGEAVDSQKHGRFQRRKRALLTAETALEIFNLRGRLAASERETGNFSSLFTARSILVSQVIYLHITSDPKNPALPQTPLPEFRSRFSALSLQSKPSPENAARPTLPSLPDTPALLTPGLPAPRNSPA
jgi:hypothetical protein